MFDGYVQEISEAERLYNEVESCLQMVTLAPDNEYWQKRLAYAIAEEITYHSILPLWVYLVPPEPAQIGPRTPEERALDEWQAECKETEFGTREWFNSLPEISF